MVASDKLFCMFFFFQAEDGIRDKLVTGVQTCALPIYHAAAEQRRTAGQRAGRGDAVATGAVVPEVVDAALPPCHRARVLVRADPRLASPGLRLGAARGLSVGRLTAARDRRCREDRLQHFALRRHAAAPHGGPRDALRQRPDGSAGSCRSGDIPERARSVDRPRLRYGMPRRRGAAAPQAGTDLIRVELPMQADIHTDKDQLVTELLERVNGAGGAGNGPAVREAFREGFQRLRSQVEMYPVPGRHASLVFESAAKTVR